MLSMHTSFWYSSFSNPFTFSLVYLCFGPSNYPVRCEKSIVIQDRSFHGYIPTKNTPDKLALFIIESTGSGHEKLSTKYTSISGTS